MLTRTNRVVVALVVLGVVVVIVAVKFLEFVAGQN
jgi:hypothetical protein